MAFSFPTYIVIFCAILLAFVLIMICLLFGKFNNNVLKRTYLDSRLFVYTMIISAVFTISIILFSLNIEVVNNLTYFIYGISFVVYGFVLMIMFSKTLKPISNIVSTTKELAKGKKNLVFAFEGAEEFAIIEENLLNVQNNYKLSDKKLNKKDNEYEKYFPKGYLKLLKKNRVEDLRVGDSVKTKLSVLFCDVRNSFFSSETLALEDNFKMINEFLGEVAVIVRKHNGFVDKFLGDGVLAVFLKEIDALNCANEISTSLDYKDMVSIGAEKLNFGIALHSGEVVVGIVGEEKRCTPTIISDAVNLVSRIEQLNKLFHTKVLMTKSFLNNVFGDFNYRFVGTIKFDDLVASVPIFESLDGYMGSFKTASIKTIENFESGVRCYEKADYEKAKGFFLLVLKENPTDSLTKYYLLLTNDEINSNKKTNITLENL